MESKVHGCGRFLYSVRLENPKSEELWFADGGQDLFNKICLELPKRNNWVHLFTKQWEIFVCKQWGKTILPTLIMEVL